MRNFLRYLLALVLLGAALSPQPPAVLAGGPDGVVGDGTPSSCTYSELNFELGAPGYITFACGPLPHTIVLEADGGMQPLAGQGTTLDGGGLITLSAANVAGRRLFQIGLTAAFTLTHLTLSNAVMDSFAGGALYNQGVLLLDDVTIHHAGAQGVWGGGAIYNTGRVTVRNSVLRDNYSAGGGALFNEVGAIATIDATSFLSNTVSNGAYGGAIANSGTLSITASTFAGNSLVLQIACPSSLGFICGGGAFTNVAGGAAHIAATTFTRNTSSEAGGGILNKGKLALEDSRLSDNTTALGGGALANVLTATAVLTRVVLSDNQASYGAGVLNTQGSYAKLTQVTIRDNQASASAGALYNYRASVFMTFATLSGNSAGLQSGAIENRDDSLLYMQHVTVSGNAAPGSAGLWNTYATADLTFVTFTRNVATDPDYAGGIDNNNVPESDLYLSNVLLVDNQFDNCTGKPPTLVSYNLSSDATCFGTGNGNQPSTPVLLGPLADNGGATLTHLPAPGSAAIDTGQCIGGLDFDQRGLPRLVGASCDIGAVERQAVDYGWYLNLPLILR